MSQSPRIKKSVLVGKVNEAIPSVLLCLIGFLLGRNSVYNMNPMVIAYYGLIYNNKKIRLWGFLAILFGLVTFQSLDGITKYVGIILLMTAELFIVERMVKETKTIYIGISALLSSILVAALLSYRLAPQTEGMFLAVVEGGVAFFLTLLYKKGVGYLENKRRGELTKETIISLSLILGSGLVGMIGLDYIQVPLLEIIGISFLLIIGYRYGLNGSAVAGFFIGLITTYLSEGNGVENFVIWSVISIISGLFRELGKVGTLIVVGISYSLMWLIYLQNRPPIELVEILLITSCVFIIVPGTVFRGRKKEIERDKDFRLEVVNNQLNKFAKTYTELGNLFTNVTEVKEGLSNKEINQLMDDVASKVCANCSMCNLCWSNDFYNTYKTVYSVLAAVESRGEVLVEDIPEEFYKRCIHAEHFISSVNRLFEIYKNNLKWENKVIENRQAYARQFNNIALGVKTLADDVEKDMAYKMQLKSALEAEVKKSTIDVVDIRVDSLRRRNVKIAFEVLEGNASYKKELLKIANKIGGRKYQFKKEEFIEGNMVYVFGEKENYKLVKGVAKTNKNLQDVSGDAFSFMSMENGLDILALSDGMGSGEKAFLESKTAIEILENLIEGGFDISTAIKTVNSTLNIKNDNQMFATLDISIVDRFSGECEFIKNGAVSTLLKRQGKVEVIKNDTLPLGMFKDVDCRRVKKKLRADDIVVMFSDGFVEGNKEADNDEGWIEESLINCNNVNPQFIADNLLDKAKKRMGGRVRDDMTVLVYRVWERA